MTACRAARISNTHPDTCPACAGRGKTAEGESCLRCEGRRAIAMTSVRTLFRKECEKCEEECDGRTFDAKDSYVLKHMANGRGADGP